MTVGAVALQAPRREPLRASVRWALLFGNFVTGCGLMVVVGTLNDITRSLQVSVSTAGQLITIAAAVVCVGAPLLAGWVAGFDRRRLLTLALLWYAAGHALCALMPSYAALWPLRAATLLAAAVFTPQAAAAISFMAPPAERGRHITFVFLGWSVASVLGLPMASWVGESFGWRTAFVAIAAMALIAAGWVFAVIPDGVKPAGLSRRDWRTVFTNRVLMAMVLVTALSGAGQFTVFAYFTPYYRAALGASTEQISLLLMWFGAFSLVGNMVLTRVIDRVGANAAVATTLALVALSLLLWPLATTLLSMAIVSIPWALGCFSSNSTQQARLSIAAPALAPALLALNTSAIYLGQAAGAASGGWLIAHAGYAPLSWLALGWVTLAIGLSLWVGRRQRALA